MLVLSVIAATIASQAVITGSFSLVSQAIAMGFCVPFGVIHTSRSIISHIYVPAVNYFLLALTLAVTIGFQTSDHITDAYGVTVCSLMVITTILYMMVMRWTWAKPIWLVLLFGIFLIIDLYTFAAICSTKIGSGGWVAIIIAAVLFIFSFSWYYGNIRLRHYLLKHAKTHLLEDLPARLGLTDLDHLADQLDQNGHRAGAMEHRHDDVDDDREASSTDDDDDEEKRREKAKKKSKLTTKMAARTVTVSTMEACEIRGNEGVVDSDRHTAESVRERAVITPGVGCFLTTSRRYTPYVFENLLSQMHAHQQVLIFLKIEYARMPSVDDEQRLIIRVFAPNIYHITSTFGYAETNLNLHSILRLARQFYDVPIDANPSNITFFLPNETIHVNTQGWKSFLRRWPLYIYSVLKNLYPGMSLNFKSVPENTVKVGTLADL